MRYRFRFKRQAIIFAAGLCALVSACDKKSNSTQIELSSPELVELTKQVRRYSFEKRKLPQSVEDLVTVGYIKAVPPAPTGKKFAIDSDQVTVVLVNQ